MSFRIYVEKVLLPPLRPGDIVVLDNLGSHRSKAVRQLIRSAGAKLFFLPKYSPDLNPIEQVFAKLKRLSTCSEKLSREPSMQSAPQSPRHSMTSPPMNAPTISKFRISNLMPSRS